MMWHPSALILAALSCIACAHGLFEVETGGVKASGPLGPGLTCPGLTGPRPAPTAACAGCPPLQRACQVGPGPPAPALTAGLLPAWANQAPADRRRRFDMALANFGRAIYGGQLV